MRVALVIYGSLGTQTGGYLYDRQLVAFLRACGDTVDVVSIPDRGYARNLASRGALEVDCDIVLEDELCHPSLVFTARRAPAVAVVHLLRTDERRTSLWHPLYAAVERRYFSGVDAAVFNSAATRASAERLTGRAMPGVVAPPAADHLPPARPSSISTEPGPLRVLCVANVLPGKGVLELIDALAGLPARAWHLTVVGSLTADAAYVGRLRARITEQNVASAVDLVGEVPNPAVVEHLAAADVVAVPSTYEAAGIAYLEAMRMGRPVLATTAGGAHEFVDDGVEGFLVAPGDAATLRDRLARWAGDRVLLARMGDAAGRRAGSHPTWAESLAPVRDLLVSVAAGKRAPLP